jgi:hypothetical protein
VLRVVQRSPLGERLGRRGMIFNLEAAVAAYRGDPRHAAPAGSEETA